MKPYLQQLLTNAWYGRGRLLLPLWPLSWLFGYLVQRRRQQFLTAAKAVYRAPVPVIVVGNITLGGTGKTPLVIWLVQQLQQQGWRPAIVSRGYRGQAPHYPWLIQATDSAAITGDEPLMMARRTGVPVMIDPNRAAAVAALLDQTDCNVVISDDGLQHYQLGRSFEILVLDGSRGTGNGAMLPLGPLREPLQRLQQVNAVVVNGAAQHGSFPVPDVCQPVTMNIVAGAFCTLHGHQRVSLQTLSQQPRLVAIAGIGNPQRFFNTLAQLGLQCECHGFPDHHVYDADDLAPFAGAAIITTEKDAVKLQDFPHLSGWYLPVDAQIQGPLFDDIIASLKRFETCPFYLY
jgi:tetraacyldisaccharide 4'-kinase